MTLPSTFLVVAGIAELKILIAVVVTVLILLANALSRMRDWQARPKRGNLGRVNPAGRNPGGREPLAEEISDFLRRAVQRRAKSAKAPGAQPSHPPGGRPIRPQQSGRADQPAEAVVLYVEPDGGVAEHVRQRMKSDFGQMPHLQTEVAQADEKLESHLHQVFNHEVSGLSRVPGETAQSAAGIGTGAPDSQAAPALAASLAAMLADPTMLRQAVLLHEILGRPEHRWT